MNFNIWALWLRLFSLIYFFDGFYVYILLYCFDYLTYLKIAYLSREWKVMITAVPFLLSFVCMFFTRYLRDYIYLLVASLKAWKIWAIFRVFPLWKHPTTESLNSNVVLIGFDWHIFYATNRASPILRSPYFTKISAISMNVILLICMIGNVPIMNNFSNFNYISYPILTIYSMITHW